MTFDLCHRYKILLQCWEKSPEARPTFTMCIGGFSECLSSVAHYFDLGIVNPGFCPEEPDEPQEPDEQEERDSLPDSESETEVDTQTIIFN